MVTILHISSKSSIVNIRPNSLTLPQVPNIMSSAGGSGPITTNSKLVQSIQQPQQVVVVKSNNNNNMTPIYGQPNEGGGLAISAMEAKQPEAPPQYNPGIGYPQVAPKQETWQ